MKASQLHEGQTFTLPTGTRLRSGKGSGVGTSAVKEGQVFVVTVKGKTGIISFGPTTNPKPLYVLTAQDEVEPQ